MAQLNMRTSPIVFLLLTNLITSSWFAVSCKPTAQVKEKKMKEDKHTNRLINETSPYLLQHAHNPVDWYPWDKEALERAKAEDKPILLSIGYSACHWCHVMEHESFENEEIAEIMNEHFISIKVDREERPDLDEIYMNAVQMMTGAGGWPLTIFLTPDLKPFYGGTYFPPDDRYGRPGFRRLLPSIAQYYKTQRNQAESTASQIAANLQKISLMQPSQGQLNFELIDKAFVSFQSRFDHKYGGFSGAPKFPQSMMLSLLLRHWNRTRNENTLSMAELTLQKMAMGGMYDQLGGGFHRYSTDERWLVPHFEKMLYDNALLSKVYLEAYQATQNDFYQRIATETLDYVRREMYYPEGGFYSTQDADSEGEEGKFFVWTKEEVKQILGENDGEIIATFYDITEAGNFEGKNILNIPNPPEAIAKMSGMDMGEFEALRQKSKEKLFLERQKRVRPGLDDKIITSWNGLMISSFALGYGITKDERYREAAEKSARFILDNLRDDGLLKRTYRNGESKINAYLEDYAFLGAALIDLYETTFDIHWLSETTKLNDAMINRFWDKEEGGFFNTDDEDESLITRVKNAYDGAIPSGTSIACMNLLRLAKLTGDADLYQKAESVFQLYRENASSLPTGFPQMLSALDFYLAQPKEIAIVGDEEDSKTQEFLAAIYGQFTPNKVVALLEPGKDGDEVEELIPLLKGKSMLTGETTVYICQDYTCKAPTTDVSELKKALREEE